MSLEVHVEVAELNKQNVSSRTLVERIRNLRAREWQTHETKVLNTLVLEKKSALTTFHSVDWKAQGLLRSQ